MRLYPFFIAISALLAATTSSAESQHYTLDPTHTRIAFRTTHANFSRALGTFRTPTGTLQLDPDDWSTAKLDITVPVATLDLGDDEWNRKVLGGTFFDAARIPQARFVSTGVEKRDGNALRVRGELTIHGVTRPVEFDATVNAVGRHPLTFRRTVGFSAVLRISRKEFGIDAWPSVIGDEVEILVELEAVRRRADKDQQQDQERHPPAEPSHPTEVPTDSDAVPEQDESKRQPEAGANPGVIAGDPDRKASGLASLPQVVGQMLPLRDTASQWRRVSIAMQPLQSRSEGVGACAPPTGSHPTTGSEPNAPVA
jgi:polyisoprenoid-binding protein YceI